MAAASLMAAPAVAGAATNSCYTNCGAPVIAANSTGIAPSDGGSTAANSTQTGSGSSGSSGSLPFTGADFAELAAIGTGAIVVGGLLNRRRRAHA